MAEEENVYKYGVSKEKIQRRIDNYLRILNLDRSTMDSELNLEIHELYKQLKDVLTREAEAREHSASSDAIEVILKEKRDIEARIKEVEDSEIVKSYDVVLDVNALLEDSNPDLSFVEMNEIQKTIEFFRKELKSLEPMSESEIQELENEIEKLTNEISRLQAERAEKARKSNAKQKENPEYIDKARKKIILELKEKIAHRRAMIAGRGDELHPNRYQELQEWEVQLRDLENGKNTEEISAEAVKLEILELKEKIAHREAMIAGRGDELHPDRYRELQEWKNRLNDLLNPQQEQETEESQADENDEEIKALQEELEKKRKKLRDEQLSPEEYIRNEEDRRALRHCLEEIEDIAKECELFKNGERIGYPEIKPEYDVHGYRQELADSLVDMVRQYYGDREYEELRREKIKTFKSHIVEKRFRFIDEDGTEKTGYYQTIEDYDGKELDALFLNLQEYQERLERRSKYEAGDISVYEGLVDGKGDAIDQTELYQEDIQYLETNNSRYNRNKNTHTNALTLGKYGERVDYLEMQEDQTFKNILRGIRNAGVFIRNHTTVPISKAVGKYVVAPIYQRVAKPESEEAGVYVNKRTHRYVARRDYFISQGQGYFESRFNSIFKAREGNKAVLGAGREFIKSQLLQKYHDLAQQDVVRKQTDFAGRQLDEQISIVTADLERTTDSENKARLQSMLDDLTEAREQVERDRAANEGKVIRRDIKTDAVDLNQHDVANKENVTRTVGLANILLRYGVSRFVGPKIKDWLIEHTQETKMVDVPQQVPQTTQEWVPDTFKTRYEPIYETVQDTDVTMSDIMSSNAGRPVEGFYSVYGGERGGQIYTLRGNEKVTAVFQSVDGRGTGLSDRAGLTAPVFTDRTFESGLLNSNGVLNQNITISELIGELETGTVNLETLEDVYVSVGDRYWVKLSDLCKGMSRQVQVGVNPVTVLDQPGYYKNVTTFVTQWVKQPQLVENTRVTSVLKKLGIAFNIGDRALLADDIYENARETDTEVEAENPDPDYRDTKNLFTGRSEEDKRNIERRASAESRFEEEGR